MAANHDSGRIDRSMLDSQVAWTLIRAAHHAERQLTEHLAEIALSPIQFGVLSQLSIEGSATNAQLARLCFVRPQTMAGVIDGMAARGLLAREGPGGRGKPSKIELSVEGTALFGHAWPAFISANEAMTTGLSADEAAELNETLQQFRGKETGS